MGQVLVVVLRGYGPRPDPLSPGSGRTQETLDSGVTSRGPSSVGRWESEDRTEDGRDVEQTRGSVWEEGERESLESPRSLPAPRDP